MRKTVLISFLVLFFVISIRLFLFEIRKNNSWTMYPSLFQYDHLLLNKFSTDYKVGDIVFLKKGDGFSEGWYRVLGLAGDKVKYWGGVFFRNNLKLSVDEKGVVHIPGIAPTLMPPENYSYLRKRTEAVGDASYEVISYEMGSKENFPETKVPDGKVFLLGDFRSIAEDSRQNGFADLSQIQGKSTIVLYSCKSLISKTFPYCYPFDFRRNRFFIRK